MISLILRVRLALLVQSVKEKHPVVVFPPMVS